MKTNKDQHKIVRLVITTQLLTKSCYNTITTYQLAYYLLNLLKYFKPNGTI